MDEIKTSTKKITIKIKEDVLCKIKELAEDEGLPYQTYINSLLRKVVNGKIKTID